MQDPLCINLSKQRGPYVIPSASQTRMPVMAVLCSAPPAWCHCMSISPRGRADVLLAALSFNGGCREHVGLFAIPAGCFRPADTYAPRDTPPGIRPPLPPCAVRLPSAIFRLHQQRWCMTTKYFATAILIQACGLARHAPSAPSDTRAEGTCVWALEVAAPCYTGSLGRQQQQGRTPALSSSCGRKGVHVAGHRLA